MQTGRATKTACPLNVPVCAAGYTQATWTGSFGCVSYACDPTFDPAP